MRARLGDPSRANICVRMWQRWVAAPANQLLETARLGCGELEYLTQHREPSNFDLCADTGGPSVAAANSDDSQIRDQVFFRLNAELWRPSMLNVTVHNGTVDLWGCVTSNDKKKAARLVVEGIPGVKAINDHLTIPPPDTAIV